MTSAIKYLAASGTLILLLAQQNAQAVDLLDGAASLTFYRALPDPLGDSGVVSAALGTALFVPRWEGLDSAPNDVVCFVGSVEGLDPDVRSRYPYGGGGEDCTEANGCGVHVHSGTDCSTTETQGGHWYNTDELPDDPWQYVGYRQTSSDGVAEYASCVRTGYDVASDPDLLLGLAFIVHAEDGGRVSCGLIFRADLQPTVYEADTTSVPLLDSGVTSRVAVLGDFNAVDGVCYVGAAQGLPPNERSFLLPEESGQIEQCQAPNGCGAHIHAGTGCDTKDTQGGHFYDEAELAEDPWLLESYRSTDSDGGAALIGCVITGKNAFHYGSRPFIIHGEDGVRLSCGLLEKVSSAAPDVPPEKLSAESSAGRAGIGGAVAATGAVAGSAFVLAFL